MPPSTDADEKMKQPGARRSLFHVALGISLNTLACRIILVLPALEMVFKLFRATQPQIATVAPDGCLRRRG
eukprot:11156864-Lingulodinium_polyedra.AAC.1